MFVPMAHPSLATSKLIANSMEVPLCQYQGLRVKGLGAIPYSECPKKAGVDSNYRRLGFEVGFRVSVIN